MTMAERTVIDIVADHPKTGKLLLVMTEARPWNGQPMFDEFVAKLGTYISYTLSDQFNVDHPTRKPSDVVVKLDCAYQPDATMQECFGDVPSKIKQFGIGFTYEVFDDAADDEPDTRQTKPWWRFW